MVLTDVDVSGAGGTILGGTVSGPAGAALAVVNGTLDGVTVDADLSVRGGGSARVINGLTLNGTASVSGDSSSLAFEGTQTLDGTGRGRWCSATAASRRWG